MASLLTRTDAHGRTLYYLRFRDKAGEHTRALGIVTFEEAKRAVKAKTAETARPAPLPAEKILDRFLKDWREVRRRAEVTVRYYDDRLRPLLRYLTSRGRMERWEARWFDDYVATKPAWSPESVHKLAVAMRTFSKWGRRAGVPIPDLARDFVGPRRVRTPKEAFSIAEVRRLLDTARGHRMEPHVLLAFWAGLSWGDILKVRAEDVRGGFLTRARSKTGAPMPIPLAAPLRALVKGRDGELAEKIGSVRRGWVTLCKRAGVPDTGGFKRLRHTYATCLDRLGLDAATRRDLMGHAPASMTDRYTHSDRARLRAGIVALERLVRGSGAPSSA